MNRNFMKLKLIIYFAFMMSYGMSFAADDESTLVKGSYDSIIYFKKGIPFALYFSKKSECNFTEREINIIYEVSRSLPETYLSVKDDFYIQKKCELNLNINTLENDTSQKIHMASSQIGKIVLTDRVFSYVKDKKYFQLNEILSKKMIVHELTHQLDNRMGYSKTDEFRQINAWERSFGFLEVNKVKAEGAYREYGEKSPKEDLATQAEGYFYDSDYLCKHPQSYVWFHYWIGPSMVVADECSEEMNNPIDPRKVNDVGYIYISPSSAETESNFGHALIRFHLDPKKPFDDYLIEAAGNISGMPALNGFETASELAEKQDYARKHPVSRYDFLWQGATGQLELKIHPVKFLMKWLETTMQQGRDIHERLLGLTRLQTRVLVYTINRDIKNLKNNYNILTKNCSSYVATVLNKATGDEVIKSNLIGIHTPMNTYEHIAPFLSQDLPVVEGYLSKLQKVLPVREEKIKTIKAARFFKNVDFKSLENSMKNPENTIRALKDILSVANLNRAEMSVELKKDLQRFVYSYTLERSLVVQQEAGQIYREMYKILNSNLNN